MNTIPVNCYGVAAIKARQRRTGGIVMKKLLLGLLVFLISSSVFAGFSYNVKFKC
ncbi:MAG: hypothetical protein ACM3YE_08390 [Bacteroidota bacterium]